jgi:hypothetical protein
VLDLASHDGRYSFAALKSGAAHVTGVEVRQSLIDGAQDAFAFYGQDPKTYGFLRGDVFEVLAQPQELPQRRRRCQRGATAHAADSVRRCGSTGSAAESEAATAEFLMVVTTPLTYSVDPRFAVLPD